MSDDKKDPPSTPSTQEMLSKAIFKIIDDMLLFKEFQRRLFAARAKAEEEKLK